MNGALSYLIAQTVRNRIGRQLGRLRKPRYAVAMVLGVGYFLLIFGGPFRRGGSATLTPAGGPGSGATAAATYVAVALAFFAAYWWLRGGVTGALAFQPAEVQLLFPAPLSRRALLGYRIARSQLLTLLNAVFWTLLMARWGLVLPAPLRFLTAWTFFSLITMHRLALALLQAPPVQGGRRAATLVLKGLAVAVVAGIAAGVVPVIARFPALGIERGARALAGALVVPPASFALLPFRLVTAPVVAGSLASWGSAIAIVAAMIGAHVWLVLSLDVEFEETAAKASADMATRLAAFRKRAAGGAAVMGPVKVKREWLPLAPLGRPSVALAWKNTLALTRTGGIRSAVMLVVMIGVLSAALSSATEGGRAEGAALVPIFVVIGMTLFMGPRALRNDLRQDLLALPLLKTYPLSGFEVVLAEMASPALVLTVVQLVMLAVGASLVPPAWRAQLGAAHAAMLVVAPIVLVALNLAMLVIQNGMALLFPSWVRLGTDSGGVEALGQNLLVAIGSMLALLVMLVPPVLEIGVGVALGRPLLGAYTPAAAALLAAGVLFAEVAGIVTWLGRTFDRTEPSALT